MIKLFVFYGEDSDSVSREIAEIPFEDENFAVNLSVSDSMFPEGKTLEAMDGFFLRTGDGQFYGAVSNEANFDTRRIRNWEEPEQTGIETENELGTELETEPAIDTEFEPPLETGMPPAPETWGQHVTEADEEFGMEFDMETDIHPLTRNRGHQHMVIEIPPETETGEQPGTDNEMPPATGAGASPTMNNRRSPATGTGASPAMNNRRSSAPGTGASPAMNNRRSSAPGTGAPPTMNNRVSPVT
ncbi:hypothetical protein, partial [Faecalicatena contorta]